MTNVNANILVFAHKSQCWWANPFLTVYASLPHRYWCQLKSHTTHTNYPGRKLFIRSLRSPSKHTTWWWQVKWETSDQLIHKTWAPTAFSVVLSCTDSEIMPGATSIGIRHECSLLSLLWGKLQEMLPCLLVKLVCCNTIWASSSLACLHPLQGKGLSHRCPVIPVLC